MSVPQIAEPSSATLRHVHSALGRSRRLRLDLAALAVVLIALAGIAIRVVVAHQSLYADELSTYWIVATHGFGDVIALLNSTYRIHHAEITPPLSFLASWVTSQIGHTPELLRAPSLVAGALTLPVIYLLGKRTVGRSAALLATAFASLSPFMIYYSAEARSYGLLMLLSTYSTLAMLLALDTRRVRWWVVYGAASCAAFYTHYTCVFLLFAQLLWLLWAHPEARRPALVANLAAAIAVVPWIHGLIEDFKSPTTKILSAISPFTPYSVRISLEHWAVGFPYSIVGGLTALPGLPALALLAVSGVLAVTDTGRRALRSGARAMLAGIDRRVLLVVALALSVPVGEAVVSAFSTHIFGTRDLAVSWPPLALCAAAFLVSTGPRIRVLASVLAVCGFGLAAAKMVTPRWQRPDYSAAARFVEQRAGPEDAIIDKTGTLSPGPLTGLDVVLHTKARVLRADTVTERDHPFGIFDLKESMATAFSDAAAFARGNPIFIVTYSLAPPLPKFPPPYQLSGIRRWPGFFGVTVFLISVPGRRVATR